MPGLPKSDTHWRTTPEALTQTAAHVARDAVDQAGNVASDAAHDLRIQASATGRASADSAAKVARQVLTGMSGIGTQLAANRYRWRDLRDAAGSAAKDARRLRVTTEPEKTERDLLPGITLLAGFGAGIAVMYFLDPKRGNRRRAQLRDRLSSWTRTTRQTASDKAHELRNRSVGIAIETQPTIEDGAGTPDPEASNQPDSHVGNGYASEFADATPGAG